MEKVYKQSWKGYYGSVLLMLLMLMLAGVTHYFNAGSEWVKYVWITAVVIDVLIAVYVGCKRRMMRLILRDYPDDPANREVAFVKYNLLKPLSSNFKRSIEIGLGDIVHIEVAQTMLETLLDVGTVIITSSGTAIEEIKAGNISHPSKVRDEIQTHADKYKK